MPFNKHDRQYDLVVWGATGFTGKRVAQHIATHFPTNLRWALAGRTESKLRTVADECAKLNPDRLQPDVRTSALTTEDLTALAKTTFILISCVGPFAQYGEPAFAACAQSGTHYLDITGEVPFTASMVRKYEAAAKATGARMIPQAAIESAAPDLVTWVLAQKVTEAGGRAGHVSVAVDLNASPSGGTLASAINLAGSYGPSQLRAATEPFAISPVPKSATRPGPSLFTRLTGLRSIPALGRATTSIADSMNRPVIERSWGLHQSMPSLRSKSYGEGFTWGEYLDAPNALLGAALHVGFAVGGLMLLLAPVRWLLGRLVTAPGSGPDDESSRADEIRYRAVASGGGEKPKAYCEAGYQGPMYTFSAILVSQAALTLLEDDLDLPGGCYTPACLGQGYVDRMACHGFPIEARLLEE